MLILLYTYYTILIIYVLIVFVLPIIGFLGRILTNKEKESSDLTISIIIPFRNEAESITDLCVSINQLKFPREQFEVIFVDDDSSDNSLSLLEKIDPSIDFNIIQNPQHLGKKASILEGITKAKYDYIFTTDADCILPEDILIQISGELDLSIGVALKTTENWNIIENLQEVESLILGGITLSSAYLEIPMLASGANLAYRKSIISEIAPYENNMDLNSGDDMFLLKAALQNNLKIGSRAGSPIRTMVEKDWNSYISQAARWAGKNNRVKLLQASLMSWIVLFANIILPISLITHFHSAPIILLIKFVVDFLFLFLSASYYERYKAILFAPIVFILYPIHLVRVGLEIIKTRK